MAATPLYQDPFGQTLDVEPGTRPPHTLRIMGPEGDLRVVWEPTDQAQVDAVAARFSQLIAEGRRAFSVGGDAPGLVSEFDPKATTILVALPMAGG